MVRINRVYTRKGDQGNTSLVGGRSVPKDDLRVDCFGTVDELNCVLGIVRSANADKPQNARRDGFDRILQAIQQRLFDLGAELATLPDDRYDGQVTLTAADVSWLEQVIDTLNAELQPLESFILPGGGMVNAHLHQARAVCRRAERRSFSLGKQSGINPASLQYLNRLSDLLFVMARHLNKQAGEPDVFWQHER